MCILHSPLGWSYLKPTVVKMPTHLYYFNLITIDLVPHGPLAGVISKGETETEDDGLVRVM